MIYWCIGKPSDTEDDIWFSRTGNEQTFWGADAKAPQNARGRVHGGVDGADKGYYKW